MPTINADEVSRKQRAIDFLKRNGMDAEADKQQKILDKLVNENTIEGKLSYSPETEKWLRGIVTSDPRMNELKDIVRKLVPEEDAVLIVGESGTGKESFAHALHGNRAGTFISINCAGMPTELIEGELFGYVRGAFTGAEKDKTGLFMAARNGTIFLDEIGDMPLLTQAKVLRVLQQKAIRPVGSDLEVKIDVRVVCATHHRLDKLVNEGKFRLDLYSRIKRFPLVTIPIRDRRGDIKGIVESVEVGKGVYESIASLMNSSGFYKDFWAEYPFDMNVRDIQDLVRQFVVLGKIL